MSAIKYGKFAHRYAKKQPPPQIPETVRAEMFGLSDLEQASYLLQTLIAQLQKQDVDAIEGLSVTFSPLRNGQRVALKDEAGQPTAAAHLARHASLHFRTREQVNSNRMNKQQLIEKVAAATELGKAEVEVAVDSVLELIAETLRSNERVDLRGFGSFVVKERKQRQGRNPRTGETITIAAKRDASFRPGKELTEKLAPGESAARAEEAV